VRFVLVHGGFHGAWCWDKLIPRLTALGHEAVAVELPGHGTRSHETATHESYTSAVVDVLEPGDVLVGHSMGGCVVTLAANQFPDVAHIVYVAGALPVEGKPFRYGLPNVDFGTGDERPQREAKPVPYATSADGHSWYYSDFNAARETLYHDCALQDAEWAFARLTPQSIEVCDRVPVSVPEFWKADLPRSYIRCTLDRALPKEFGDSHIARLGVEPLMIATSHSPFLSRPADLALLLTAAVKTKPIHPLRPSA
jgi:pimeloyl-ACP methyl ester carboxylesterase